MSTCESAEDTLLQANVEFLDKNFKSALELYNLTIELDDTLSDAFLKRSLCFEKLKKPNDAVADTNKAIALDPMNIKAYYQKGVISLDLGDTQTALECFEKCQALDNKDSFIPAWIHKCKSSKATSKPAAPKPAPPTATHTSTSSSSSSSSQSSAQPQRPPQPARPPAPMAPKAPRAPKVSAQTKPKEPEKEPAPAPTPTPTPTPAPAQPAPSNQKYTWYQSVSHVIVTIFVKSAKPNNVAVEFETNSLNVNIELSSDNQFLLDLDLASDIDPQGSTYEVMSTKVEIKLKKAHPVKWDTLERKEDLVAPPAKKQAKNWDKILANEEEDKDTGFNQLMRDMYSGASEEERRAMMKSFHESGGTVLSCDWKDVGKGNVDPKPPVGVTRWEKDSV